MVVIIENNTNITIIININKYVKNDINYNILKCNLLKSKSVESGAVNRFIIVQRKYLNTISSSYIYINILRNRTYIETKSKNYKENNYWFTDRNKLQ